MPYFYYLPKVHKVSEPIWKTYCCFDGQCHKQPVTVHLHVLQPLVSELPSYVCNSSCIPLFEHFSTFCCLNLIWIIKQAEFVLKVTEFCMTNNYFVFNSQYYQKAKETDMGTNFAPCYANLAMRLWEVQFVLKSNPFAMNIIYFGWYIDYIIIWDCPLTSLPLFVAYSNDNTCGFSFTYAAD